MAKSLGKIHNVNFRAGPFTTVNTIYRLDLPGQLTEQLQRLVRCGTYHKLVGLDLTAEFAGLSTTDTVTCSGRIRYFTPTKGRCEAFRGAFRSMANVMKSQGVSMRDNKMYDFRVPLSSPTALNTFANGATLDGTNGLALVHSSVSGASVFGVHNEGVQPVSTTSAGDVFTSGFDTILQGSGGTDFVLNDALPFTGSPDYASEQYEEIPFSLAYVPPAAGQGGEVATWQFRADPALYVAVMCGQMEIIVDELSLGPGTTSVTFEVSALVSGWKSIMGNPDRKPRRKSSKKKKV